MSQFILIPYSDDSRARRSLSAGVSTNPGGTSSRPLSGSRSGWHSAAMVFHASTAAQNPSTGPRSGSYSALTTTSPPSGCGSVCVGPSGMR